MTKAIETNRLSFFSPAYLSKAKDVFLQPYEFNCWDDVVNCAVGQNTFRGFHKLIKSGEGAKTIFTGYFRQNQQRLIAALRSARNETQLHEVCNRICDDLKQQLTNI